jgi:hypothetical protein
MRFGESPSSYLICCLHIKMSPRVYSVFYFSFWQSVQYVIRSDLRWCPTFHKLKTLVLNDCWCKPVDSTSLACILEHAPILEKLTVEFSQQVRRDFLSGKPLLRCTVVIVLLFWVNLIGGFIHQRLNAITEWK